MRKRNRFYVCPEETSFHSIQDIGQCMYGHQKILTNKHETVERKQYHTQKLGKLNT